MENKLELKHLAPYLPYGLKGVIIEDWTHCFDDECINYRKFKKGEVVDNYLLEIRDCINYNYEYNYEIFKPILRPLSDLTKEIEHNGEKFVPIKRISQRCSDFITDEYFEMLPLQFSIEWYDEGNVSKCIYFNNNCMYVDYWIMNLMFEWHFDVFGLIEKGLAIDINTIENKE